MAHTSRAEQRKISRLPYTSHFAEVDGAKMHYVDEGQGDPILFVHGVPTSCYLWRNVIPYLSTKGRCIAPDLIGMGQSDKPAIDYGIEDHIRYFTDFIDKLDLNNITLVLHGWGSVIGFAYAAAHPDKIKGLVVLEGHLRPATDRAMLSLPLQELAAMALDDPKGAKEKIIKENYFLEQWLPMGIARNLSDYEMNYYREAFKTEASRKLLWQYLSDLPLGRSDTAAVPIIENYQAYLEKTDAPKLLFYAIPGFNTLIERVAWAKANFSNLELVAIETSLHYAPESHPKVIGQALSAWYDKLGKA